MSKDRLLAQFKDILEPRKKNNDAVGFMTRHWDPQPSYRLGKVLPPAQLKTITANSGRIDGFLDELCLALRKTKPELKKEVTAMLEEIGLDKKMYVVRWLGVFTTKVLCRMCSSVFVNEMNIFNLKSTMGSNPVVFVPTHRSYADFILMTYVSFYYDIDLPAVAAGMDFHAMVGMGRVMRDTCAFYMRRTFVSDRLYGAVFRQYVRTLITSNHQPVEFFIEGMRSRSGKSLPPKYGFMSMVLEPMFASEVPDVTFVPINISYDRVMEERLFAYELLGVPKPKESTSALLKALNILNDNYGSIYINIGTPFSAKEFLGDSLKRSRHAIKPVQLQIITPEENEHVQTLAHEIIHRQQRIAIVTTFQMIAVSLTMSIHKATPLNEEQLYEDIIWMSELFKSFGGNSFDYDTITVREEVKMAITTHNNFVRFDKDRNLRLVNSTPFLMTDEIKNKMKGHQLSQETMLIVIPVVMLQLYVNPVLHWLVPSAIICQVVQQGSVSKDALWESFKVIQTLLKHEFPVNEPKKSEEFETCLQRLIDMEAIQININYNEDRLLLGENARVQTLLVNLLWPFTNCLDRIMQVLTNEQSVEERSLMKSVQKSLEWQLLNEDDTHPYSLSLDCILNCIQGLVSEGSLTKERKDKIILYHINFSHMAETSNWMSRYLLKIRAKFDQSNPVMMEQLGLLSRL